MLGRSRVASRRLLDAFRVEDGVLAAWTLAFYAMFVVAPRELADPEDSGVRWVIRFGLYLAASLLGIGWLAVIGP